MAEVALEIDRITKRYAEVLALRELRLAVRPGEIFGLVGAAGAGKTTALRIALGLIEADAGEVRWRGRPVDAQTRTRLGYLPQRRGLPTRVKLTDHLVYLAELHGLSTNEAHRNTLLWTDRLGLRPYRTQQLHRLEARERHWVELASALVHEPDALLLDEPFAGLAEADAALVASILRDKANLGDTIVLALASAEIAEQICDRIVLLHNGLKLIEGTVAELHAAAPTLLVVDAPGAQPGWSAEVPGCRLRERIGTRMVLELPGDVDEQTVLAAALRTGPVLEFHRRPASVAELHRDLITVRTAVDGGFDAPPSADFQAEVGTAAADDSQPDGDSRPDGESQSDGEMGSGNAGAPVEAAGDPVEASGETDDASGDAGETSDEAGARTEAEPPGTAQDPREAGGDAGAEAGAEAELPGAAQDQAGAAGEAGDASGDAGAAAEAEAEPPGATGDQAGAAEAETVEAGAAGGAVEVGTADGAAEAGAVGAGAVEGAVGAGTVDGAGEARAAEGTVEAEAVDGAAGGEAVGECRSEVS